METLTRLYYLRHSFDTLDFLLTTIIVRRLSASIAYLSASPVIAQRLRLPSRETLRSSLVLYAAGLLAQAKNIYLCTLIYFGLEGLIRPEDLDFLSRFIKPPTDEETPLRLPHAITSWPLPICRIDEDPKRASLNKLVSEYERRTKDPRLITANDEVEREEQEQ
jgi:hypothetical protein